jgi:hypothetical protein
MRAFELLEDRQLGHVVNAANKARASLSNEADDAIEHWQAMNWETGELAKAHGDVDSALIKEINSAFQPVRAELKKQFGDTIPLSRGEQLHNKYSQDRVLYSWTYDPIVAKQFSGQGKEYATLSNEQIQQLVNRYNSTGYVQVFNKKLKRNKRDPMYFDIYDKGNNFVTDGDNIEEYIVDENNYRKERNAQLAKNGKVYTEEIPIDNIVWVTNQLGSKEFIVAQAPKRS